MAKDIENELIKDEENSAITPEVSSEKIDNETPSKASEEAVVIDNAIAEEAHEESSESKEDDTSTSCEAEENNDTTTEDTDELPSLQDENQTEANEACEDSESETQTENEAPDTILSKPLTEEEMRDARYLPRESVIYDENADDADSREESVTVETVEEDGVEIYSLNFFNEEETKKEEEPKEEPEEKEQEPYDPKKPRKVDARFDFVELFVFTLAIVIFITSFIVRHSVVVGPSMENTLFAGERLLISDLFYTPDYGDIIVFQDQSTNVDGAVVKRVIGKPGDVIEIKENGSIFRNGTLLIEEYVYIDGENIQENRIIPVPEGEYFVLGDHRNRSEDSRSENFGTIKEDSILGRVLLRFYPFDRFGTVK